VQILIVDDHPFIRKGLIHVLQYELANEVVRIDEAGSHSEALSCLSAASYDLILLDVSLEGRNGLDLLMWIRKERPHTPVLVISMHPEDQYALRAIRLGAAGYLSKQSAPAELMTAITGIRTHGRYISHRLSLLMAEDLGRTGHGTVLHEHLSNREMEIGGMIARGESPAEIAEALNLSVKTVNTYRTRLLNKLAVRNNVGLTSYFIHNNLIP